MQKYSPNNKITAPLLIVGVLYLLCSYVYHSYAIIDDEMWICYFYAKDSIFMLGLLYIIYKVCHSSLNIFMVLSLFIYKLITLILSIYTTLKAEDLNEYIMYLSSPKITIPLCMILAIILILIIKIYKLWTR